MENTNGVYMDLDILSFYPHYKLVAGGGNAPPSILAYETEVVLYEPAIGCSDAHAL